MTSGRKYFIICYCYTQKRGGVGRGININTHNNICYIYLNILKHTAFRCQKISLHLFFYVVSSALFADLFIDASNSVNKQCFFYLRIPSPILTSCFGTHILNLSESQDSQIYSENFCNGHNDFLVGLTLYSPSESLDA